MKAIRIWLAVAAIAVLQWHPVVASEDAASNADRKLTDHPEIAGALALIDRWLDAYQAYEQIPGISVGVVVDQNLIFSKGYGYANVRRQRPATPETLYSICSISKLFTSIGVMQQRDAGRLRLSDPVADHLDWFDVKNAHPDGGPITVESLITHSSGLPREADFPYWSAPDFAFPDRAEMIARLEQQETLYPASTYFQYSNLALTLAGEIVAARSGKSYAEYVRQHILEPLSLDDTQPNFREDEYGKRMAVGYSARHRSGERSVVTKFDSQAIAPAAGFTSNVTDLAAFASWQFRLLKNGGSEVLDASTLKEMHRVHWTDPDWKTTWGLGFVVAKAGEDTLVGHGGRCPGYRTAFAMLPKHQLAVIVMMNATGVNPQKVSQVIFKTIGPVLAAAKKPPSETLEDLSLYEGVYDAQPWSGESAIVQWGNKLVVSGFPSDDPMASSIKLKRSKGHEFRRIRDDGDTPGEVWVFDVNDAGDVVAVSHHSNTDKKLR